MKALFFDIDGTLVSFNTHRIPQSAVDAIAAAHRAGHKIIISTGRPRAIITNLGQLQSLGLIDGYITMNGAYCYVGSEVLCSKAIPTADARAVAMWCEQRGCPCIFVDEEGLTIAGANELAIDIFCNKLSAPPLKESDYASPLERQLLQITPFFTADEQPQLEAVMPGSEFGRWHPAFVDITAKGATKAHGLDVMLSHFGLSVADAVAFGDGGNDVPMLRHAAVGVAMGNAADDVKAAADYVTSHVDDDGIAKALVELLA